MKTSSSIWQSLLLVLGLLLVNTGSVYADNDHERARVLREAGEILPLETILSKVTAGEMDRVLEVELKNKHGRYVYEIEILDAQGVVWERVFDARSGQQLEHKREDD